MVYKYNLYAPASEEYPLIQFHQKETPLDSAIGYQKAAMVFHMLRREIGDEGFFSGLRTLVKERTGSPMPIGEHYNRCLKKLSGGSLDMVFHPVG